MRAKRAEFTDRQKADIFVRDRALCCYSGKNMWLLDYGGGPSMPPWIEHCTPASKGGAANLENGILVGWYFNRARSNRSPPVLLFLEGLPTRAAFDIYSEIPEYVYAHFERFAALHWSDWFVNQAVFHLHLAAGQLLERRKDGKNWVRGTAYRCGAALKALQRARTGAAKESVASLAERGLLPASPSPDQLALIQALDASSISQLEEVAQLLVPYMKASFEALAAIGQLSEADDPMAAALHHRDNVAQNPYVVPQTKRLIVSHIDRMNAIYDRLAATREDSTN